jgi:hypothetical protein
MITLRETGLVISQGPVTEPACRSGACHGGVAQDVMARFVVYMSLTPQQALRRLRT